MIPKMYSCCKKQPSWIFVYKNKEAWGICDKHFESPYHQHLVESVINLKTAKLDSPFEIFSGVVV